MKKPDCILTQPMNACLQDFAVALFFMSCVQLVFLSFESVAKILRCGTFSPKIASYAGVFRGARISSLPKIYTSSPKNACMGGYSENCYKVKYFFGAILFAYLITALARLDRKTDE